MVDPTLIELQAKLTAVNQKSRMVLVPTVFDDWWHNVRGGKKLISTIKVLTSTKLTQLQMRIGRDEPVNILYKYVDKYRDDHSDDDYHLVTIFPQIPFS